MGTDAPDISVILCTHNPRMDVLEMTLDSLRRQTLQVNRWELIIVDNYCDLPLDAEQINRGGALPMKIVCENQTGLTFARRAGIHAACAPLLMLVDDDNFLEEDYLESALKIARGEPKIGVFGGAARAIIEGPRPRRWQKRLLPFLGVRDYGSSAITSHEQRWGKWEPIGAGAVVRREVAGKFLDLLDAVPEATRLDRSGRDLLSGGDSLLAQAAYRSGFDCSYQPSLRLKHFIKRGRLRLPYLTKLMYGHGRSVVILNSVLGRSSPRLSRLELAKRLPFRCKSEGFCGAVSWAWDLGYVTELRQSAGPVRRQMKPPPRPLYFADIWGTGRRMLLNGRKRLLDMPPIQLQTHAPELSVILCTFNPRRDILKLVLESLAKQTLDRARWELIIVDNNSNPALEAGELNPGGILPLRLVRETEPGLTAARRCGVGHAAADLLVLVDDDNILDNDYLQASLEIARSEPKIGAFGGSTRPVLETESVRKWQITMLPYLGVRDYGKEPITEKKDEWGKWEPIGAGMVVRKDVAQKFIEFVRSSPQAGTLGRNDKGLLSGEDSLIARTAYRLGYSCSYQPRLKLGHFLKKSRFRLRYLTKLLYGHGRSYVILHNALGQPQSEISVKELLIRLPYRCIRDGLPGVIIWAWDVGYRAEARAVRRSGQNGISILPPQASARAD